MSCGEVHSQARELVAQGYTATLVATTLLIGRSSLYYRKKPRGSRADRTCDEQIVFLQAALKPFTPQHSFAIHRKTFLPL